MTQPTQAVGSEANPSVDARTDALNAFDELAGEFFPDEEEKNEQPAEGEPEQPTEEAEEETGDEAEEADELPPIDAPISWDAEAKERFAKLPREDQEYLVKREGERERFLQTKAQEAARAKQDAETVAMQQLAQIQQQIAQQYDQLASQVLPKRPDPAMLQYDPQGFYAQQAAYEGAVAQQQTLQQQAQEYAGQAQAYEQHLEQQRQAAEYQTIAESFPEYLDPTTGPKLQQELSNVAREMGYSPELIQQARADDIKAMRKAAEWKAKADQLDKLNASKMEKVRAARGLPKVAKPGVAVSSDQTRQVNAAASFDRALKARTINERAEHFGDWAAANGLL